MERETEERVKEICRLRKEGKTRVQIAEEMHCSVSTVDRALHLYGDIPVRDHFEDHRKEIMEMYHAGETLKRIAAETGISITTINRHLLEMGLHRGKGRKPGHGKQEPKKQMGHREKRQDVGEQDLLMPGHYADNTKKAATVVIRGKVYQDVSAWYM